MGCLANPVVPDHLTNGTVPIGRPIANTRVYILDAQGLPLPIGVTGELHIGGTGVARGYLNQPELTAERFITDPFSDAPDARLYKTGDLARWLPDGTMEFLGRNDFQVKIRGFRIELGEIEARLREHETVHDAVVIARQSQTTGQQLVAYHVSDDQVSVQSLKDHLAAALPDYMVPAAFVALDALPLTPNGKLDRNALPDPDSAALATSVYEAPQGELEQTLAGIWSDLLAVERVGRHDNFFALGGDSLLVVQLISGLREAGLQADVRSLFSAPNLADLAASLDEGGAQLQIPANLIPDNTQIITPDMLPLVALDQATIDRVLKAVPGGAGNVQDIYPLAPLQEGMLFHHLAAEKGEDVYERSSLLSFEDREAVDDFLTALQQVIDRHDILRTGFVWEDVPQPVQVVRRQALLPVEQLTLEASSQGAEDLQTCFDPRTYHLDISQAPLLQAKLAYDQTTERWLLLLLYHHLIMDAVTLGTLVGEVQAHLTDRVEALPAPVPFRNFVAQARLDVSNDEHEAFFRDMLGDVDEPTAPFDVLDVRGDDVLSLIHI